MQYKARGLVITYWQIGVLRIWQKIEDGALWKNDSTF